MSTRERSCHGEAQGCYHPCREKRSRGRDRGLERFDGDCGIAQREEKRIFF